MKKLVLMLLPLSMLAACEQQRQTYYQFDCAPEVKEKIVAYTIQCAESSMETISYCQHLSKQMYCDFEIKEVQPKANPSYKG